MRGMPPPIRNLELRDRLSEQLGEALEDRRGAAHLYLLRSFGRLVDERERVEVPRGVLIEAAEIAFRQVGIGVSGREALGELLRGGLLEQTGEDVGEDRLTPGKGLLAEWSAAISRTEACCRALETLYRRPIRPTGEVERAMDEAACLFNEGLFFEVHEVLEAVWLKQEGDARPLLQGLIQIAVGFHHLENRNLNGALSLLREGREKLKGFCRERFGLNLDRFLEQADECRRTIESLGSEAFDRFDRQMIPRMHLSHGEA